MKLESIFEAYGQLGAVNGTRDLVTQLSMFLPTVINVGRQLARQGHERKVVNMQMSSRLAKWFNQKFLSEMSPIMRNLKNPEMNDLLNSIVIHGANAERLKGENASGNLLRLMQKLPNVLRNIPELKDEGELLDKAVKRYRRDLEELLELDPDDDEEDFEPVKREPTDFGKQANQAEDMINDILNSLPNTIRGDVRNSIAKSGNRLQSLMRELQRRGIKIS